eukprot:gnl/MRDRNA2_/MRDRNA2_86611_c0_seq7.p1 gnl/MRDRNA2_/MRDRNA2_86611_c0~~gnl/MRDRNA2_/MRDRNA2_86611_c0_seq7.p1  ORF type:complete len:446 (+),score=25.49 gnl/MRDRNA2_/MRDRNA2_86611_c0_seq7:2-1339(+)
MEFAGYGAIGKIGGYCQLENFVNLAVNCLIILLLWMPGSLAMQAATVLIYWMRLLGIFRCAEKIGMVLMPIQRSTYSVFPALVVTVIFFIGIVQAMSVFVIAGLRDEDQDTVLTEVVFTQFGILFAADYPSEINNDSHMQLLLYIGILFFTIGLLNIFISVISESYMLEMEKAKLTFNRERACGCLTYLLRMRVSPITTISFYGSLTLSMLSVMVLISFLCDSLIESLFKSNFFSPSQPYVVPATVASLVMLNIAVLQDSSAYWATAGNTHIKSHYLWLAELVESSQTKCGQLAMIRKIVHQEVQQGIQSLREDTIANNQMCHRNSQAMQRKGASRQLGNSLLACRRPSRPSALEPHVDSSASVNPNGIVNSTRRPSNGSIQHGPAVEPTHPSNNGSPPVRIGGDESQGRACDHFQGMEVALEHDLIEITPQTMDLHTRLKRQGC